MKDKQGVSDHFSESLKNLILVMHSAGTFELASRRSGQDLWALTWAVLARPEMQEQLTQSLQQERVAMAPPHTPKSQHLSVTESQAPQNRGQGTAPSQQIEQQLPPQLSFPAKDPSTIVPQPGTSTETSVASVLSVVAQ